MKQLVLDLKSGKTALLDVPAPIVQDGELLIQTSVSLISPGTERMLVDFGKASWIQKALQQPERVKQVLNKIKTDGLRPTFTAVKSKLDQPLSLGYSQSGKIIAVGKGVSGFSVANPVTPERTMRPRFLHICAASLISVSLLEEAVMITASTP